MEEKGRLPVYPVKGRGRRGRRGSRRKEVGKGGKGKGEKRREGSKIYVQVNNER